MKTPSQLEGTAVAGREWGGTTGHVPLEQQLGLVFVAAISQETPHLCLEFCLCYPDTVGAPEVPSETEVLSFIPLSLN